jgi:tetratricopeptide (TPR) repeat protein
MDELAINRYAQDCLKRAWLLADQNDTDGAICLVDEAICLRPTWPECRVIKGRFLLDAKRFCEAEASLREAIHIDEMDFYAWLELGFVFYDQELFEKAAFCFRKSAQINPHYSVYTMLANAELAFDTEAAKADAQRALDLNPDWDEARRIRDTAIRELETSGE